MINIIRFVNGSRSNIDNITSGKSLIIVGDNDPV